MSHGGDRIAEVLQRQGVKTLFTLCGGHISPILVGAKALGIRIVDTRHEVDAVFAADATARLTGIPGVAAVTAGPGLTNSITAVKNAQMAQSPVVILGGATATVLKGRGSLQDIDQQSLMAPHVKWQGSARRVRELAPLLETAFAMAREGVPGPVFLECPVESHVPARPARPPRVRAADRPVLARITALMAELNAEHFGGTLPPLPVRLSSRMRRRLGELRLERKTGRAVHIGLNRHHVLHDPWPEVRDTVLHELVHQWQAQTGRPVDHGAEFRRKAREVGIQPRAVRTD